VHQAEAISLSDFVRNEQLHKIDLLKLDCEGSEYPILYETPSEVLQRVNALTIEVHDLDSERRNIQSLDSFLKSQNYQTSYFKTQSNCYSLFARKV
jgi:hypothetical protein